MVPGPTELRGRGGAILWVLYPDGQTGLGMQVGWSVWMGSCSFSPFLGRRAMAMPTLRTGYDVPRVRRWHMPSL